jgi:hypothetical protein
MNEPNYYAVIPAPVRYCEGLTANAKLLYGELSALCKQQGFCWATNAYFADLYKVSASAISEWVSALSKHRFIRVSIDPAKGNERKIFLNDDPHRHLPATSTPKGEEGSPPKGDSLKESSTKKNSIMNPSGFALEPQEPGKSKKFTPPEQSQVEKYMLELGMNGAAKSESERFCDHHGQGGWVLKNGRKMIDWKCGVRLWKSNFDRWNPAPKKEPAKLQSPAGYPDFLAHADGKQYAAQYPRWETIPPGCDFVKRDFDKWMKAKA